MVAWYCKIEDIEHGPFSQADLVKMAGAGRLKPGDLVRNETKDKWYKASAVKGLTFGDNVPPQSSFESSEPEQSSAVETSAEATRLLQSFGGGKEPERTPRPAPVRRERKPKKETEKPPEITKRPPSEDDWTPRTSKVMQKTERKPLKPRTKKILWAAGGVLVVLFLFPPHRVPEGFSMPKGWYFRPIFSPPIATVKLFEKGDKDLKGVGALDPEDVIERDGVFYAKAPMPIHELRLLLMFLVVLAVTGAVIGLLSARDAAAEIPEAKPAHPQRRPQV